MTYFSVLIATLGLNTRPSLINTLRALRNQVFRDFELLLDDGGPNEYAARNRLAKKAKGKMLAFTDDDTVPLPDWLQIAYECFESNPKLRILTGPVKGNLYGFGEIIVDMPYWGIGCNMFIDRKTFMEVGGFEEDWGLDPPPRGWRSDTDILYRIIDKFGEECYMHVSRLIMLHPEPMKSIWVPEVEERFYLRHRDKIIKWIAPHDPRLCSFVLARGLEKDEKIKELLKSYIMRVYRNER